MARQATPPITPPTMVAMLPWLPLGSVNGPSSLSGAMTPAGPPDGKGNIPEVEGSTSSTMDDVKMPVSGAAVGCTGSESGTD